MVTMGGESRAEVRGGMAADVFTMDFGKWYRAFGGWGMAVEIFMVVDELDCRN